jgi:hypothetical protein
VVQNLQRVICLIPAVNVNLEIMMERNDYINYKRVVLTRNLFIAQYIILLILIAGITSNFLVVTNNGGRMPFYSEQIADSGSTYISESHFSFINKEEVKYYYLSDIIPLGDWMIVSIGDIIMAATFVLIIFSWVYYIIKYNKTKRIVSGEYEIY